jgi:heme/copper-type cytochrome/quinol oxidase subunit 3
MDTTAYPNRGAVDDAEPADLLARNIRVGSRLWAASQAFFFISFFFAFLYLRALNTNGLWRGWPHHHPNPSLAFGVAILICVLASAVVARASSLLSAAAWRLAAAGGLLLVLAAVGLQSAQFSSLGFGPTDGAYASVFVGWTGLFTLMLVGVAYWLATVIGDAARAGEALQIRTAAVDAVSFVLLVLAGVEIAAFILLYVVK